jgi:hypothetical protein
MHTFSVGQLPNSGPGRFTVKVCRSHTIWHTHTPSRSPLNERSARCRDYLPTQNTTNKRTSMPSAGFEPAILAIKRLLTYALDRTATLILPYIPFIAVRIVTTRARIFLFFKLSRSFRGPTQPPTRVLSPEDKPAEAWS